MARLISCGFELNDVAHTSEFQTVYNIAVVQTGTVRTGTYAGQLTSLVSATAKGFIQQFSSANANGPYFLRCYFNFATLPSAENRIMGFIAGTSMAAANEANITIDNGGLLRLYYNAAGTNTVIGSPSSALSTGTWYLMVRL